MVCVLLVDPAVRAGVPQGLLVRAGEVARYTRGSGIFARREPPADTAVREAMEETCVEIAVERLIAVRVVGPITYPNGDVSDYVDHTFRCRWVEGEPRVGDDEATEAAWWPTDALPPMGDDHVRLVERAVAGDVDPYLGPAD